MSEPTPSGEIIQYPLLPLRDVVVFPHMVIPLFVGRPKSIKAMETAMEAGKSILLVAQRSAAKDDPGPQDMYAIGCVSNILQMLKLPDGTVKVLVEGGTRAQIREVIDVRTLAPSDVLRRWTKVLLQITEPEVGRQHACFAPCFRGRQHEHPQHRADRQRDDGGRLSVGRDHRLQLAPDR